MKSPSSARIETHKGRQGIDKQYIVFRFFDEDKYPFMITVARAKLILKHLKDMENFIETYGG